MDARAIGDLLAPVNATLNLTATICLILAYIFIKQGRKQAHGRTMLAAVTASGLFLIFYVIRFSLTGTHRFAGEGAAKVAYLSILFSHMILAVAVVPIVLRMLYLAKNERFEEHRRMGRWGYPIWLYVSVTGLIVYLMLYQIWGYLPEA